MDSKEAAFIKGIHSNLRKKYKEIGDVAAVWNEHIQNDAQLQKYALSMEMLAEGQWKSTKNTNRIQWCHTVSEEYFLKGGYQKVMDKERRRTNFHKAHNSMIPNKQYTSNETVASEQESVPFTAPWSFQCDDEKLYLLDVGSCYNPFKEITSLFSTVALDLYPSRKDVFKADFLQLEVVSETDSTICSQFSCKVEAERSENKITTALLSADGHRPSADSHQSSVQTDEDFNGCNGGNQIERCSCKLCVLNKLVWLTSKNSHGQYSHPETPSGSSLGTSPSLSCLPSCSFDVVVFSLFLSYFPAPAQRFSSCVKAKNLLRLNGLLLIIESDSAHLNRNSRMIKSWKHCLESIGFSRYKYEKHKHLHCMAFRKVKDGISFDEVNTDLMFIPQDFHDETSVEMNSISSFRSEEEDQDIADGFGHLPSADIF